MNSEHLREISDVLTAKEATKRAEMAEKLRAKADEQDAVEPSTKSVTFSHALNLLQMGRRVARAAWTQEQFVAMHHPPILAGDEKMTMPYLYWRTGQGDLVPWLPDMRDLLADDWMVVR